MALAHRAGHEIYYEMLGDPAAPPLLLIMGLAIPSRGREWLLAGELGGLRCAAAQMAAVVRHATHRKLSAIGAPTLVITGDADRLVPPRNSEVLAKSIPGAKLLVLPGAGHAFPLE